MINSGIEPEAKKKIIGLLHVLFPNAHIYLYGSRARGTHREYSDIDLALDCGKEKSPLSLGEARSILEATHIPYKIDLVDIHAVSATLANIILKEGILWTKSE